MSDSAGNAEAVTVEASVVEAKPKETSDAQRFLGIVAYGIAAIVWYAIIRMLVLAPFALVWMLGGGKIAAATWMLFAEPLGLALGAYLTLLTNRRNRPFHLVLTVIVFASVVFGHISWTLNNQYVINAPDTLEIAAAFMQGVFVLIGALIGFWRTKPKELKIPKMLLPPKRKALRASS